MRLVKYCTLLHEVDIFVIDFGLLFIIVGLVSKVFLNMLLIHYYLIFFYYKNI
jgi:hypothetical protein